MAHSSNATTITIIIIAIVLNVTVAIAMCNGTDISTENMIPKTSTMTLKNSIAAILCLY